MRLTEANRLSTRTARPASSVEMPKYWCIITSADTLTRLRLSNFADRPVHDFHLVFAGALPSDHADLAGLVHRESGNRGEALCGRLPAVNQVVAKLADGANPYRRSARRNQVFEVAVDGGWLFACVGEDRHVARKVSMRATRVDRRGLDPRAQVQDVEGPHGGNRTRLCIISE